MPHTDPGALAVSVQAFYCRAMRALHAAGVPFMVGGAYAYAHYTGVARHTKDLDLFLRAADVAAALAAFEREGYRTEVTYTHWLAKVFSDDHFVDLIYNLGNGAGPVDDDWFAHAVGGELLGVPVKFVGPTDMVFSKVYTMDRVRYDGADIAHLLRACGDRLDWPRLLARFEENWRVLLSHLVLFGFIYPSDRDRVPAWVMHDLLSRLSGELRDGAPGEPVCRGTLLSPTQYQTDIERWGYRDARLRPQGEMTPKQIDHWTQGVQEGK